MVKKESRPSIEFSFRECSKVQTSLKSTNEGRLRINPPVGKITISADGTALSSADGKATARLRGLTKRLEKQSRCNPKLIAADQPLEPWDYWQKQSHSLNVAEGRVQLPGNFDPQAGLLVRSQNLWRSPLEIISKGKVHITDIAPGDMLNIDGFDGHNWELVTVKHLLVIHKCPVCVRLIDVGEESDAWMRFSRFNLWRILQALHADVEDRANVEQRIGYRLAYVPPAYFFLMLLRMADRRIVRGMTYPSPVNHLEGHELGPEQKLLIEWIGRTQPKRYFERVLQQVAQWKLSAERRHCNDWIKKLVEAYVRPRLGRAGESVRATSTGNAQ